MPKMPIPIATLCRSHVNGHCVAYHLTVDRNCQDSHAVSPDEPLGQAQAEMVDDGSAVMSPLRGEGSCVSPLPYSSCLDSSLPSLAIPHDHD